MVLNCGIKLRMKTVGFGTLMRLPRKLVIQNTNTNKLLMESRISIALLK